MGISWGPRSSLSLTRAPADAIKAPRGLPFTRRRVGAKVLNRRCLAPLFVGPRRLPARFRSCLHCSTLPLVTYSSARVQRVFVLGRSRIRLPGPSGDVKLALRGAGATSGSACGSCDQWMFGLAAVVFAVRSFGTRVAGSRRGHFQLQVSFGPRFSFVCPRGAPSAPCLVHWSKRNY